MTNHQSEKEDTETKIRQLQTLHDKNNEIIRLLSTFEEQELKKNNNNRPIIPYIINTKIVANFRMRVSHEALVMIHDVTDTPTTSSRSEKKKQKTLQKLVQNTVKKVLADVEFGTSLEELIQQAEDEIQNMKAKKLLL